MKSSGFSNENNNDISLEISLNISGSVSSCEKKKEGLFTILYNDIWSQMILTILSLSFDLNLSCSFLINIRYKMSIWLFEENIPSKLRDYVQFGETSSGYNALYNKPIIP